MGTRCSDKIYWVKPAPPSEMKKYSPTIILAITLLIGEIHTFWEKGVQRYENWIIQKYEPMTVQWNVKMVGDEVSVILYFIAMWLCFKYPNHTNKVTVAIFIGLAVVDTGLYFLNFKTVNYHYVYFCMALVWILAHRKTIKRHLFG